MLGAITLNRLATQYRGTRIVTDAAPARLRRAS
jgi:hypothetical protein